MPEPFKNQFNKKLIINMGDHFARAWPNFDRAGFVLAASKNLRSLELKERSSRITDAMTTYLPDDFEQAAEIMLASLATVDPDAIGGDIERDDGITGWAVMPMTCYVGENGTGHFDLSMELMRQMTVRFSAEFGIRFLLLHDSQRALSTMRRWTKDPSEHVRRLVSEGIRPRLPWAMRLPVFVADPSPIVPLLEALKDDSSEYVRRSVANNLNDIAKDHPGLVAEIAKKWLRNATRNREKLVRHACRTLIKQGHTATLRALGYRPPIVRLDYLNIQTPQLKFGNALSFECSLTSESNKSQALIIDYAIHHQKANGSTSPKVFKWKTITLERNAPHSAHRQHKIRKITTRTYYAGTHRLELLINGVSFAVRDFELLM